METQRYITNKACDVAKNIKSNDKNQNNNLMIEFPNIKIEKIMWWNQH